MPLAGGGAWAARRVSGLCTLRGDGCNRMDAEFLKVGTEGHFRVPGRSCPTAFLGP